MFGRKNHKKELRSALLEVATYLDEKGLSFVGADNTGLKTRWNVVLVKYQKVSSTNQLQANIASLNSIISKGIDNSKVMGLLELLTASIEAVK